MRAHLIVVPIVVLGVLVCSAGSAAAERKVMVLPSDGRADAKVRTKVDAAMLKLAKSMPDTVTPGDVSYNDLAAAMGCKGEESSCRDEVLGTLAVDEIVITTVTPKPGGFEVSARRATKQGNSKDVVTMITPEAPDKIDAIAPLFVGKAVTATAPGKTPGTITPPVTTPTTTPGKTPPPTTTAVPPPTTTPTTTTTPAITSTPPIGPPTEPIATTTPATDQPVEPPKPELMAVKPVPAPVVEPRDDNRGSRRRLYIAGMAGGGAMLIVGIVLWGQADAIQKDIDAAPTKTKAQLAALVDLEASGDRYATWGNVFAIGGLVLGGVSTYYFIKHRRSNSSSAHLVPAVFDHGGGVAITFGAP